MRAITHEEFVQRVVAAQGDTLKILGVYKNRRTKILTECTVCGLQKERGPQELLDGFGCKNCYTQKQRRTHDEFKQLVEERNNGEFELRSSYVNSTTKVTIYHTVCDREFDILPQGFLSGHGCKCTNQNYVTNMKRKESFPEKIRDITDGEYILITDYVTEYRHVEIRHVECGYVFPVTPHNFVYNGSRCPQCNESKGERRVKTFLENRGIPYMRQFKIDLCKNTRPLPFDFAVFNQYGLRALIEYDGKQHYIPTWGAEHFEKTCKHDRIKDTYCVSNDIHLIRIPYTEFDRTEEILSRELSDFIEPNGSTVDTRDIAASVH